MKKKLVASILVAAMAVSMAACGATGGDAPAAEAPAAEEAAPAAEDGSAPAEVAADLSASEEAIANPEGEGQVLNIYCWNEEFKSRLTDHYPGYVEVDAVTGTIGDVTVNWIITPSDDNAYQNKLDETLLAMADGTVSGDDAIDLFLVEADYAMKYTDSEFTAPVAEVGITEEDVADQYQYTKDVVTANGELKGVSWQGCPGVLVYRADIAEEVLGTSDPAEVQEYVKDWDTFAETAGTLADAGYKITSTVNDTYRVFSNNVTSKWVEDGAINVDENIMNWVEMSKEMVDAGYTDTAELWSDDWNKGFYEDGDVFCYFGPAWLIDFCMAADAEGSVANAGGWMATEGPQGFFWGGTWICAAAGTDNPTIVGDIMRQLTCNADIMTDIVKADNDFVNNKPAMEAMAQDETYGDAVLGGQNALPMFCAGVEKIDLSNISNYDQGCTESFQQAMKNYFDGNATLDEAMAEFETSVMEKYPELK